MNMRHWNVNGRRPRHSTAASEGIEVTLHRAAGQLPQVASAELIDLARHGARLRSAVALVQNELVTIFGRAGQPALDLHLTGAVRWRQQEATGRWLHGCQFTDELPLETLGELFLRGILSARPPESSG